MDGIEGLLAQNFGVRPQGKAAPMAGAAASRPAGSAAPAWTSSTRSAPAPSYDDLFSAPASASSFDSLFDSYKPAASSKPAPAYDDDVFSSVPGLRTSSSATSFASARDDVFGTAAPAYDDVFGATRSASPPPPAYDDDLLAGFASGPQPAGQRKGQVQVHDDDDLLGGFGRTAAQEEKRKPAARGETGAADGFDDLIPGFTGSVPPRSR
jgi:hypothetical protein